MHSVGSQQFAAPLGSEDIDNRYEVLDLLERGGMSIVYKAHDRVLDRVVALKTIKTSRLEEKQVIGFQIEAKAISSLKHDGIVRVLDFGIMKSGQPYLVLDFVEGETVFNLIRRKGRLGLHQALTIMSQVCEAMSHAHIHGVIHRDLKSNNIMLKGGSKLPQAKVIDFGIAVVLENPTRGVTLTPCGAIVGSPSYMSPEQIAHRHMDTRTDIYSLGCVLFEMLTGRVPFRACTALEVMQKHIDSAPPAVPRNYIHPQIYEDVNTVVQRALQKNPNDRYQSIEEFHDDVLYLLDQIQELKQVQPKQAKEKEDVIDSRLRDSQIMRLEAVRARRNTLLAISFLLTAALGILTIFGTISTFNYNPATSQFEGQVPSQAEIMPLPSDFRVVGDDLADILNSSADTLIEKQNYRKLNIDLVALGKDNLSLDLGKYDLSEVDLAPLKNSNLTYLAVWKSHLPSRSLVDISRIKNLQSLAIARNNNFKASDMASLKNLKKLTYMDASICELDDEHVKQIVQCKTIQTLKLGWNEKITARSVLEIAKLPNLAQLELQCTSVDPDGLAPLAKVPGLRSLKLDFAKISDRHIDTLSNLRNLKILSICYSRVSHDGLVRLLTKLPLDNLRIVGTRLSDIELEDINQRFPKVQVIESIAPGSISD